VDTKLEGSDPLLGSRVADRYTVMRRIARGGMGVVYLAVQDGLQRTVALKIIRPDAARDPVMQKRFEREARLVSQLAHPNIVTVHDFGHMSDGSLYLAMEFVDGVGLREALRKRKFSVAESLPIVEAIAQALAKAHATGLVHRDLKPENVMLPASGVPAKVLDFGLAKPHDPDLVDEKLTRDGGFVGTPGYAAPEQTEGAPEHPRQDLYALGVVWFELLFGAHPFPAPSGMRQVARQLAEDPPDVDGKLPDLDPRAASLLRRLLARNPDDRPESANAVLAELAALRTTVVPAPAATSPAPPSPAESSRAKSAPTVNDRPTVAPQQQLKFLTAVDDTPSRLPWIVAGVVVVCGAAALALWPRSPPPAAIVDAGEVAAAPPVKHVVEKIEYVDVILDNIPTFTACEAVKLDVPGAELEHFRQLGRSWLRIPGMKAPQVAELLQGIGLVGDVPLVLEVKELEPDRVVLAAVKPEDASLIKHFAQDDVDGGEVSGGLTP
jgi:serine/threonine-protein kinase